MNEIDNKKKLQIGTIFLALWMVYATILFIYNGHFVFTQKYKYPPRFYYLSYAIGITLILYWFIDSNILKIKDVLNKKIIIFISSHTMWIYLWHIIFIKILEHTTLNWLFKYIITVIGALVITYVQSKIVSKLNIKNKTILVIFNS